METQVFEEIKLSKAGKNRWLKKVAHAQDVKQLVRNKVALQQYFFGNGNFYYYFNNAPIETCRDVLYVNDDLVLLDLHEGAHRLRCLSDGKCTTGFRSYEKVTKDIIRCISVLSGSFFVRLSDLNETRIEDFYAWKLSARGDIVFLHYKESGKRLVLLESMTIVPHDSFLDFHSATFVQENILKCSDWGGYQTHFLTIPDISCSEKFSMKNYTQVQADVFFIHESKGTKRLLCLKTMLTSGELICKSCRRIKKDLFMLTIEKGHAFFYNIRTMEQSEQIRFKSRRLKKGALHITSEFGSVSILDEKTMTFSPWQFL